MVYNNKIYWFSEKLYFLSKDNGVCSDVRATTILTENECRSAISKIPEAKSNGTFKSYHRRNQWPKGCLVWMSDGRVFWNDHATGSPKKGASQVCIAKPGM